MSSRNRNMIHYIKCSNCKKEFKINVPLGQYCYKLFHRDRKLYFCSDHCKREFEKEHIKQVIRPGSW